MKFDALESAKFWSLRNQTEQATLESLVDQAQQEARHLAQRLKAEAGAEAVYLFGSLAEGTVYRLGFDHVRKRIDTYGVRLG